MSLRSNHSMICPLWMHLSTPGNTCSLYMYFVAFYQPNKDSGSWGVPVIKANLSSSADFCHFKHHLGEPLQDNNYRLRLQEMHHLKPKYSKSIGGACPLTPLGWCAFDTHEQSAKPSDPPPFQKSCIRPWIEVNYYRKTVGWEISH